MLVVIYGIFISNEKYKKYHSGFQAKGETTDMRRLLHKLGRPLGLQMGMETASFSLCAVMQGWIGADPLAAHQIMTSVGSTCFMVYYGIGAAVAIRVSHFYGVNDIRNVRRSSLTGYLMILAIGLTLAITISTFITDICAFFTDDTNIRHIVVSLVIPFVLYQFRQFTTRHCRRTPAHALRVPVLHCHFPAAELSAGLHIPWRTGRNMDGFPCGIDVGRGTLLPPFPP